ncbi:MAG: methylated-DNA--[Firmicutes bacterium]|nr:methylated-DNA--[protein]-cysteine S-methyltransferase [Bacillota bacterium]MBR2593883.1 methylated-DNA--[protein]-cysteine S-methyltransferase [Bacillota bacterium]
MYYYSRKIDSINITVCEEDNEISRIYLGETEDLDGKRLKTYLIGKCLNQLEEYFEGKRKTFSIPVKLEGTPFQLKVWETLLEIPYGETRTYGEIAKAIGSPKAARAVGMANNKNPVCIIVPCHRVVGAGGALVGYAWGLEMKERLLELERKNS